MIELTKNNGSAPGTRIVVNEKMICYLEKDLLNHDRTWVYFRTGPERKDRLDVSEHIDQVIKLIKEAN